MADNDFIGGAYSLSHRFNKNLDLTLGSMNTYIGDHYEKSYGQEMHLIEIYDKYMTIMLEKQKPAHTSK